MKWPIGHSPDRHCPGMGNGRKIKMKRIDTISSAAVELELLMVSQSLSRFGIVAILACPVVQKINITTLFWVDNNICGNHCFSKWHTTDFVEQFVVNHVNNLFYNIGVSTRLLPFECCAYVAKHMTSRDWTRLYQTFYYVWNSSGGEERWGVAFAPKSRENE